MTLPGVNIADPYSKEAKSLLQPLQSGLHELTIRVANNFYDTVAGLDGAGDILKRLRASEFESLRQRLAEYLRMLLSDDLTQATHLAEAQHAGLAHALVGVQILWLIGAYNDYQDEVHRYLRIHLLDSESRERLMRVVSQRILLDLEGQVSSYQKVNAEITSAFVRLDQHVMSTPNLTDLVRGALDIIGDLSGGVSAFFARVDDLGQLQIEQFYGVAADQYHQAMERGEVPRISIDPAIPSGQGPGGKAWRSAEIIVSDAWLIESDKAPWRCIGEALGFRSSAAIPLLDESGRSIALLSLYSTWPGYFSSDRIRSFFRHAQRILSYAIQQRMTSAVVPLREQQAYRRMLSEQRVAIYYQPIINLDNGSLAKIEALARLQDADGSFVSPLRFLPALGRDELLMLFVQVLKQACRDWHMLKTKGINSKIAINFPAEGLDDPRYEKVIFEEIEVSALPADQLQLEILETQDGGELTDSRSAFIQRLRDAGVEIAEDDLGSGHSSLLRLDQYSFDEVKIDQGLVRGVLHNPKRAVEFIMYLTRLAHAFNIPVTVEGLENTGMIEAAAVLGADRGQGYGIAKPMSADELPIWYSKYVYSIHPARPKTAIGALAGYLLWDLQLATISERPELIADFVGAKAIVDEFIAANHLQGSLIDELIRRNHELASSNHMQEGDARHVRTRLIEELTKHWLATAM